MIRTNNFKLIVYPKAKKVKLFDLKNDPYEITDLSNKTDFRNKTVELFDELLSLQKEMDDTLDLKSIIGL